MFLIKQKTIGENKGTARLWLDDECLCDFGFNPGSRYRRDLKDGVLTITLDESGSYKVSRKKSAGFELPIIDIQNADLERQLGIHVAVRIVFRQNTILIRASDLDQQIQAREHAFIHTVTNGQPLEWGSVYHGAGILDSGLHEGFEVRKLAAVVKVAVEIDGQYLGISRRNNHFWDPKAVLVNSPIELLNFGRTSSVSLHGVTLAIPCTGASRSGRSKNKLQHAEDHDLAGAQVFHSLDFIKRTNPSVIIIENVTDYASTASWSIIRAVLTTLGYVIQYREFSGAEFGAIEDRTRMVVVALSKGLYDIFGFDIDTVTARKVKPENLSAIMDLVEPDSHRFKPFQYLKDKQEKDIMAGKGFRMQWLDGSALTVGTIGRGYNKCRSTEPFIRHPDNPQLARLLTPAEHARAKTIPVDAIAGVTSETTAHEVLGQSVVREWFVCIGIALAESILSAIRFAPACRIA